MKREEKILPKLYKSKTSTKKKADAPTTPLTSDLVDRLEGALLKSAEEPAEVALEGIRERVIKRIARCGLCSRREAEKWILEGRVKIDGEIIKEVGASITPQQVLAVDNIPIKAEAPKLFIFNKVRNMLITRNADEKGRETLGQLLAEMGEPTLLPVGRLDYTSEGLLLLTNDGELKQYLERPESEMRRVYRVRVYGRVTQDRFRGLERGITIDGFRYKGLNITVEDVHNRKGPRPEPQWRMKLPGATIPTPETRANTWLTVEIFEGKNREIRRVLEHLGLQVSRLIRIQYGPYLLTPDIESGIVKPVPIVAELKEHTNQNWNWHPTLKKKPKINSSLVAQAQGESQDLDDPLDPVTFSNSFGSASAQRRSSMPKSNPPPEKKPRRISKEPLSNSWSPQSSPNRI